MSKLETTLERLFFSARWMLAPFFFGLMIAVIALLFKFFKELYLLVSGVITGAIDNPITNILTLVDSALLASLLLIIAFSGYENFVSKMSIGEHEDRPGWMGKVGFSDLKLKLIGAIVAISAVELLKVFVDSDNLSNTTLAWKVGIHLTFVVSGVLFALTDAISDRTGKH
ncbi:TIGR00645 family protein [Shewanella sp.]|uniref:TIGR00645 family protein n=1 Tax=Shewanella sp. TaxID=50422 RepID=UPI003A986C14